MADGIYVALSGAVAQERALEISANNVANSRTVGFRRDDAVFSEVLAKQGQQNSAEAGMRFVSLDDTYTSQATGTLEKTGAPLDVALTGDGYFVLQQEGEQVYTRAGSFVTGQDGTVMSPDGLPVVDKTGGTIRIPDGTREISIGRDGGVFADGAQVGEFSVVRFAEDTELEKLGSTMFRAPADAVPLDRGNTAVEQGFVEQSNVNVLGAMNDLVTVSRSFDAFQKLIDAYQNIDDRTAKDLGRRA